MKRLPIAEFNKVLLQQLALRQEFQRSPPSVLSRPKSYSLFFLFSLCIVIGAGAITSNANAEDRQRTDNAAAAQAEALFDRHYSLDSDKNGSAKSIDVTSYSLEHVVVPPHSVAYIEFRTYCLDSRLPAPSRNENMHLVPVDSLFPPNMKSIYESLMGYSYENPKASSQVQRIVWNMRDRITGSRRAREWTEKDFALLERVQPGSTNTLRLSEEINKATNVLFDNIVESANKYLKDQGVSDVKAQRDGMGISFEAANRKTEDLLRKIERAALPSPATESLGNYSLPSPGVAVRSDHGGGARNTAIVLLNTTNRPYSYSPSSYALQSTRRTQRLGIGGIKDVAVVETESPKDPSTKTPNEPPVESETEDSKIPILTEVRPSTVQGYNCKRKFRLVGKNIKENFRVNVRATGVNKELGRNQISYIDSQNVEIEINTMVDPDIWKVIAKNGNEPSSNTVKFSVKAHSDTQLGARIGEFSNVTAKSNGKCTGSTKGSCSSNWRCEAKYQCVEYVKRYYRKLYPKLINSVVETEWKSAQQFWDRHAHTYLTKTVYSNSGIDESNLPSPGDMIFFDTGLKDGHVAIVMSVDNRAIKIIQQNIDPDNAIDELTISEVNVSDSGGSANDKKVFIGRLRDKYTTLGWLSPE